MTHTTRCAPGVYRTEHALIERTQWGDGWHLFIDDQWVQTFATKREAVAAAEGWKP